MQDINIVRVKSEYKFRGDRIYAINLLHKIEIGIRISSRNSKYISHILMFVTVMEVLNIQISSLPSAYSETLNILSYITCKIGICLQKPSMSIIICSPRNQL